VTRFVSEALAKHERAAFLSGNDRIDLYFRETVSQDVKFPAGEVFRSFIVLSRVGLLQQPQTPCNAGTVFPHYRQNVPICR
jgi:hypothetical protein